MRNPTKKQVQKVIDNFAKVLPYANKMDNEGSLFNSSIDMSAYAVSLPQCGTPMCHGGWYCASYIMQYETIQNRSTYDDGADLMANDLGFVSYFHLQQWAQDKPKLWGNNFGGDMFSHSFAFNFKKVLTLQKIVNHWKKVQKRLPK